MQPDIDSVKRKNIIYMALTFTAMMRVFSDGSKTLDQNDI